MSEISFDENRYKIKSHVILGQPESPAIIKSLINHGLVKNEKQAQYLIFFIIFTCLSSSVFIIYNNFFKAPDIPLATDEQQMMVDQLIQ